MDQFVSYNTSYYLFLLNLQLADELCLFELTLKWTAVCEMPYLTKVFKILNIAKYSFITKGLSSLFEFFRRL